VHGPQRASQLQYFRARYYSPRLGRFISSDPLGIGGGANGYAYAAGSPTNFTDPLGLYATSVDAACAMDPNFCAEIMGQIVRNAGAASGNPCLEQQANEAADDIVLAGNILTVASIARAAKAGATIFKTAHYATRLEAAGVNVARAESVIAKEVAAMRGSMEAGADVAGRMRIDNVLVEYRARLLPDGSVNVGTIFPVKP
jgi:RHS repeat-associated protein